MYKLSIFVLSLFIITSCSNENNNYKPKSTGQLGSLIVVSSEEGIKNLGNLVDDIFLSPTMHLDNEPFFSVKKINAESFMKFFYNHKTVLVLVTKESTNELYEVLETFSGEKIQKYLHDTGVNLVVKKDLLAYNQHVVFLFGETEADIKRKLNSKSDFIVSSLLNYEIIDENKKLFSDTSSNDKYYEEIKKEFGVGVRIPKHFNLMKKEDGFYWFQMEAEEEDVQKIIGLTMHSYPYSDTSDFSYASIRTTRDSTLKYKIPGELPGTYMGTTESKFYPPIFKEIIDLNGRYTSKIRGWWTIRGMTMAGPFVRYVVHVKETNKLFAFEGFVYKPNLNTKEKDLRMIEAIALSIK